MLLHVLTAGIKLIYADNNPHCVAIGLSLYKSDNFSFVHNCVFQCEHETAQLIFPEYRITILIINYHCDYLYLEVRCSIKLNQIFYDELHLFTV